MFKSGQKEVPVKDFYRQRQITNIFTIDVNKVMVSDKVSCNNGKDCCYIADYEVYRALIPLFIKMPKIYLAMVCHNTTKTVPMQCHLMFLRQMSGCLNTKIFGMRLVFVGRCLKN